MPRGLQEQRPERQASELRPERAFPQQELREPQERLPELQTSEFQPQALPQGLREQRQVRQPERQTLPERRMQRRALLPQER